VSRRGRRRDGLVREPDAGDLHVRFDEGDVETGSTVIGNKGTES
jgi:hypothetical protein